ncbi:MAG: NIL domain-containing protein [Planctomycetota bacterium]
MATTRLIHCTFPQKIMEEPLLYKLGKNFKVVPNIRGASITEDHGTMDLELQGTRAEIDRVIDYLRDRGVEVHVKDGVEQGG